MNRRSLLRNLAAGAATISTASTTTSAVSNPPSESHTTCSSWNYQGSTCIQSAADDYETTASSNCYYEYSCDGDAFYRRECCYDPYALEENFKSITLNPVGTTHHADLSTSFSRESAWIERCPDGNCPANYWQGFFNVSSNAVSYDDNGLEKCLLSESNITIDRSGDGDLYTYIDKGVPDSDYVGATNNLDKSTQYGPSDYGKELIKFAISFHPIGGVQISAQETLASMNSMATAEYETNDTIELGYSWGNNSPCNYGGTAAEARHWLLFEMKQMYGGDTATLDVTDELTVEGPTVTNNLTMSVSAPPYDPDTLRSMSSLTKQENSMETTTLRELTNRPTNHNIPPHIIKERSGDALVYIGDT